MNSDGIPAGWGIGTLGDFVQLSSGRQIDYSETQRFPYPVYGANGVLGWCSSFNVENVILVGRVGASGSVHFVEGKAWANDNTLVLDDLQDLNKRFLYYWLLNRNLPKLATKTAQPLLTQTTLKFVEILLPPPTEQHFIAKILEAARHIIAQTDQLIRKLTCIKEGLLQDLLTKGLDEESRIRDPEKNPEEFKDSESGRIPIQWEIVQLAEVAEIVMGQSPPGNTYNSRGLGVPLINGPAEYGERYPTKAQWTTAPTKMCRPGDILLCVRGSTTGRINISNDSYCIGRGVAAVRGRTDISLTPYLELFLIRLGVQILSEARGSGSTFPSITSPRLARTNLFLPKLSEQERIVKIIQSIKYKISLEKDCLQKAFKINNGLMNDLLSGKVRTQNWVISSRKD